MDTRRTARLLFLDPSDRLLLMRIREPASPDESGQSQTPVWVTIGGRLEPGETVLATARREALEETGIAELSVGPIVWYGEQVLEWAGETRLLKESFVLVRGPSAELSDARWTDEERSMILEMRWWTLAEIFETNEIILPKALPQRLGTLLEDGLPGRVEPIEL